MIRLLGLGRGGRRAGGAAGDPAEQVGGGRRIVRERQLMGSSIRLRAPVGAPPPFERAALYHPSPRPIATNSTIVADNPITLLHGKYDCSRLSAVV
ncbi:hypothetical protein QTP88_014230 [Uroleucon formosanum]